VGQPQQQLVRNLLEHVQVESYFLLLDESEEVDGLEVVHDDAALLLGDLVVDEADDLGTVQFDQHLDLLDEVLLGLLVAEDRGGDDFYHELLFCLNQNHFHYFSSCTLAHH